MSGWIKLHRQIKEWEWYDDTNTFRVFMHLLLSANIKPNRYHGHDIPVGSLVTSVKSLAKTLNLSCAQVRLALSKLSVSEIANETTNNFSIISIVKWDYYQSGSQTDSKRIANGSQTDSKRIATLKEIKNKEVKNKEDSIKSIITKKINKPEDVSDEIWADWCRHRKIKKAIITNNVLTKLKNEGSKIGWTLEQVLSECCQRGWIGFNSEWVLNKQGVKNGYNNKNGTASNYDKTKLAAAEALAELRAEKALEAGNTRFSQQPTNAVSGKVSGVSHDAARSSEYLEISYTPDSDL